MAILKNGLWGGITGKLGNTVCYMLNGKQVVRMIVKSSRPPTEKQLINRAEMALVNAFLRQIKELIRIGYGPLAKGGTSTEYNLALSHTKKYALKGEAPNREIDYSKVLLSKGRLPNLPDLSAQLYDNVLQLSWSAEVDQHASYGDQVMLLAYFPSVGYDQPPVAFSKLCGVDRGRGQMTLELPAEMSGRPVEVYVFVVAVNGKSVSTSQYLGRLM